MTRAAWWMILAQLFFAGMNLTTRLGAHALPWSEIAAVRFLVGALVAVVVARGRGTSIRITDRRNAWLRSLFGTGSALGTFYALASPRISVGDAATLGATGPIFVALLSAPLLGERVGRHLTLAVLTAFAGVVAVVQPSFESAAPVALAATGGAVFFALAMIWLRKLGPNESGEAVVFHFSVVAAVITLALSLPVWQTPDRTSLLYLLGTGLSGGLAQVAMTRAYALDRAARVSALGYLSIVLTHGLAIPLFRAPTTLLQVIGTALVIGGGLLVSYDARREVARQ
ncbi:MAG: DMT family transporter [Gemmatimonadales bacterium]